MIRLSSDERRAVRAMYELARTQGHEPVSIREISRHQNIPIPHLEQVLSKLRRAGLVESYRGIRGGYRLTRSPEQVSIGDVIRALEGDIALSDCVHPSFDPAGCAETDGCVIRLLWMELGGQIEQAFDEVSLRDLMTEARELG